MVNSGFPDILDNICKQKKINVASDIGPFSRNLCWAFPSVATALSRPIMNPSYPVLTRKLRPLWGGYVGSTTREYRYHRHRNQSYYRSCLLDILFRTSFHYNPSLVLFCVNISQTITLFTLISSKLLAVSSSLANSCQFFFIYSPMYILSFVGFTGRMSWSIVRLDETP